jgi:hypothetical protein
MEKTHEFPVLRFTVDAERQRKSALDVQIPRNGWISPEGRGDVVATGLVTIDVRDPQRWHVLDQVVRQQGQVTLIEEDGRRHLVRLNEIEGRRFEKQHDGQSITAVVTVSWEETGPAAGASELGDTS